MAKIEKFEDIEAWKKARVLVKEVYKISCAKKYCSDYSLIDQTKRSSISIMANIAEGFARRTKKEFINFLGIAHASAAELQSHLYVALDQKYISHSEFSLIYRETDEVSKMIQGFINYLKTLKLTNSKTPKLQN
ncbi:MAG: four helix bundle protein [Candidatus Marinimicrobia bacterium]|nr:four helix bundle protein [Candidatus Neomarinimicrobiota bacterium]